MKEYLEEIRHRHLLDQIDSVLAKDPVVDIVAVISVGDALEEELERGLHSHEEGEEDSAIRQHVAEPMGDEEEQADDLGRHGTSDELSKDYLCTSMRNCPMSEEQIGQAI